MNAKEKAAGPVERKSAAKAPSGAPSTGSRKDHRRPAANERAFSKFESASTATEVQIQKLIARLRMRPHHTHELRACGISHPAGRVRDLIGRGYTIASDRVTTVDSDSFVHCRVALYGLISEPVVLVPMGGSK